MEVLAAGLGDDIDDCAGSFAEFRAVIVAQDLEFFDGVHGGLHQEAAVVAIVLVKSAVDQIQVGVGLISVDGHAGVIDADAPIVRSDTRDEVDELTEIPLIERKGFHLIVSNEIGNLGAFPLQHDHFTGYRHTFGYSTHPQFDLNSELIVDVHVNAGDF